MARSAIRIGGSAIAGDAHAMARTMPRLREVQPVPEPRRPGASLDEIRARLERECPGGEFNDALALAEFSGEI